MSTARHVKQLSYAGGCLIFLAAGITVLGLLLRAPAAAPTVIPSPSVTYKPITLEQVSTVRHATSVDVAARLRNLNTTAGVASYPVAFVVTNERGEELIRREETTYLLPGSLQYAVALNIPVEAGPLQVRVDVPAQPTFQELPPGIRPPAFGSFVRGEPETRTVGATVTQQQRGIAANEGSYDLQRVEMVALALDAQKNVIGIGKTFVGELKVGERREFTVQWPLPRQPTAEVLLSASANVFEEENVIRVIGDPGSLR